MERSVIDLHDRINKIKATAKANKVFLLTSCISVVIFSVWLFAFYPANLSYDSINQLSQLSTGILTNAHPYIHTIFLGIFVRFFGSVAGFAFFQIVISSLLAGLFASYLCSRKVNKLVIIFILLAYWFSPVVGIYNVTIWKDVLFAQLILLLGYVYLQILEPESGQKHIYYYLGVVLAIALVRHNGAIYLLFAPTLLYFAKQIKFKTLVFIMACLITVYLIVNGPLAASLGVRNGSIDNVDNAFRLQLVASILSSNNANLSKGESDYYQKIMPQSDYVSNYHCSSVDGLIAADSKKIDKYFISSPKRQEEFILESNVSIMKNLPIVVADRACLFTYQIGLGTKGWYDPFYLGIYPNSMGYKTTPNQLGSIISRYLNWTIHFPQRLLFWDYCTLVIIYLSAFIYAIILKSARILGFVSIICINVPVIALIGVSNDFRYLYMLSLAILFLLGVVWMEYQRSKVEKGL